VADLDGSINTLSLSLIIDEPVNTSHYHFDARVFLMERLTLERAIHYPVGSRACGWAGDCMGRKPGNTANVIA